MSRTATGVTVLAVGCRHGGYDWFQNRLRRGKEACLRLMSHKLQFQNPRDPKDQA